VLGLGLEIGLAMFYVQIMVARGIFEGKFKGKCSVRTRVIHYGPTNNCSSVLGQLADRSVYNWERRPRS